MINLINTALKCCPVITVIKTHTSVSGGVCVLTLRGKMSVSTEA